MYKETGWQFKPVLLPSAALADTYTGLQGIPIVLVPWASGLHVLGQHLDHVCMENSLSLAA